MMTICFLFMKGNIMAKKTNVYGAGSWDTTTINGKEYVRYRKKYESINKVKVFYGKTQKEVKQKIHSFEETHGYVNEDVEKIILSDYIMTWLKSVKKNSVKETSYNSLIDTVKYYIEPFDIGTMQMGTLSSEVIQQHFNYMASKYSMSAIKKVKSLLNMVFKYALIKNDISKDPMLVVEIPSPDNVKQPSKIEILNDEQMDLLFEEANRVNIPSSRINGAIGTPVYKGTNKYIIILILYTGMRIGEALGLKWSDYNKKEKTLRIGNNMVIVRDENDKRVYKENSTKTLSGTRIIKLPQRAIWAIDNLRANTNATHICVTVNNITPSQSSITRTLKSMLKNAQIECDNFGLHDLRHTYASYQLRHGVDAIVVSKLIGHKSPETTMRIYAHVIEEQKIKAVEIFDAEDKEEDKEEDNTDIK